MDVCMSVVYQYIYIYIYIYMYTHIYTVCRYIYTYTVCIQYIYTYIYTHTYICVCALLYMGIHIYISILYRQILSFSRFPSFALENTYGTVPYVKFPFFIHCTISAFFFIFSFIYKRSGIVLS